ncbi:MAG TPA: HlyD family efflux transporter periplasmic adaptor subunit [Ktedonobacteraceae bacterium]|nr:HlyD family efflux transporter periplasmic adaptor subunit [Ktedonobacteraceae bacterium]
MSQQGHDSLLQLPNFNDDDDDAVPLRPTRASTRGRNRIVLIIIAVFLLIVLLGGTLFFFLRRGARTTALAYGQVSTGNFVLTVSATGPIQGGTYNVVFSGSGKISEIDVAVGQTVQKGQVLAKLDPTSLQDAVNAAQASVLSAQTALTNAQNSYAKTVGQSQASVASAQTALNNAQTGLSNTQSQSQASIASAQTALSNAQANLTRVEAESSASISAAQTALTNAQNSLSATKTQAQQQISTAYVQEQQAIATCNAQATATATASPTATPTPNTNCIQLAEDQYNQAVASANASVTNAEDQVATAQKQLASAQVQAAANNAQAQQQITTDESQLNTAQAQANSNNSNAQGQVNSAQAQLNSALASSASSDSSAQGQINSAQAQLNSALVALQTAQHNLNNATLTAPHAGIVTEINGSVGGTPGVSSSSSSSSGGGGTFIQIVDNSALQVVADVDEADTANLKVGEPVLFTVSAYGSRTFRGTVSAISPSGQSTSNVVTYPVYIDVDMNNLNGATLLPGMTANVTIDVVERIGVLLIPVSAVNFARTATSTVNTSTPLITQDQASVALDQAQQMLNSLEVQQPNISSTDNPTAAYILEGTIGHITAKPVVLGLTDDTEYEVLSGLSAGETIITGTQTSGRGGGFFNGGSNSSGG